ncbi:unnamed protein product [Eruca vesicaria subsp. sativa]|uniref:Uncharacterized protein n=1 Tax=Eruca vesicaria subsp. sativa TaxID=29727 RepID=A0ABC8K090_ERUVS|nr:unnamed protein product [Eruca vesicaria subsp. sativa]
MNRIWDIVVCLFIVGLDVAASVVGILAGVSQNRVCSEPSHKAFRLGLGAILILEIDQILVLFRALFFISPQDEVQRSFFSKKISYAFYFLGWIASVGAAVTLAIGVNSNRKSGSSCGFTHHLLTIGGILCFFRALFSADYYVSTIVGKDEAAK